MICFITFGQVHAHHVNGITFDKDLVAAIECSDEMEGRTLAFATFGDQWHQCIREDQWPERNWKYFPRGAAGANCDHQKNAR